MNITTRRCSIRLSTWNDFDDYAVSAADPEMMRHIRDGTPHDTARARANFEQFLQHIEDNGYGLCTVSLNENNDIIGFAGLFNRSIEDQLMVELGYRIIRPYWSQGFATEVATAIHEYACDQLGLASLISVIQPSNNASKRVAAKLGFEHPRNIVMDNVTCQLWVWQP